MPIRSLSWAPVAPEKHGYSPLPGPRSIRLLESLDREPDYPRLCYSIRPYFLEHCPPYTALSYPWSASVFTDSEIENESDENRPDTYHEIECDGRSRMINDNLFQALLQLSKSKAVRFLWVDAICIDQGNIPERQTQVLLMGEIYASASRVIIWLGNDRTDLSEFVWLHTKFVSALDWLIDQHSTEVLQRSPLDLIFRDGSGLSLMDWYRYWWAYFRFFRRRRWFYRAWVVQEVALAGKVDVFISDVVLPWEKISGLARFVLCSGWGQVLAPSKQVRKDAGLGEIESMWLMRDAYKRGTTGGRDLWVQRSLGRVFGAQTEEQLWYVYLVWAIDMVRKQRATDPRDRIYSILGIAERFIPPGIDRTILPNYSASPEDVFTQVATVFLQKLPFLSLLSMLEDKSERTLENLPSWVPDWSVSGSSPVRLGWMNQNGQPHFDASFVERLDHVPCRIEGRSLLLRGALFDRVTEVSDPISSILTESCATTCLQLCQRLNQSYHPTKQPRQEVLWRTLVADELDDKYPALEKSSSQFRDWARMILAAGLFLRNSDEPIRNGYLSDLSCLEELCGDAYSLLPSKNQVVDDANALANALDKVDEESQNQFGDFIKALDGESVLFASRLSCTGASRRLYRTTCGFLGLGPESVRKDDQVWLVQGARVPFVFRQCCNEAGLKMVGETYLHGFMHGALQEAVGEAVGDFAVV